MRDREGEKERMRDQEGERKRLRDQKREGLREKERSGEGEERPRGRREISQRLHFVRLGSTQWLHFATSRGNSGQYGFG